MQSERSPHISEEALQEYQSQEWPHQLQPVLQAVSQTQFISGGRTSFTSAGDPAIVFNAFVNTVVRLERLLDRETAMLSEHQILAFDDFNRKKCHGLLELRRAIDAMHGLDRADLGFDAKPVLAQLRMKLQKNLMMLQTHLDAARSVAAIIARTIQEHESDGTYTQAVIHKETI
jgi:hypothetical protein